MPYYRICPQCGASLDPGEHCDCDEETALDAANIQSGKVEIGLLTNISNAIVQNEYAGCQG